MRTKVCLCLGVVVALALAALPARAADDAQPVPLADPPVETAQDACLDYTPAEPEAEPTLLLGEADAEPVVPGCKPCKDRPLCTCSYNGAPRISCNPCCYRNNFTGQTICRD